MISQKNWEGRHLDKNILVAKSTVYSSDTCLFVPSEVNSLFSGGKQGSLGEGVVGVCFSKKLNKYKATMTKRGKPEHLGYYATVVKAHEAYRQAKGAYILELAAAFTDENDWKLREALIRRANSDEFLKGLDV